MPILAISTHFLLLQRRFPHFRAVSVSLLTLITFLGEIEDWESSPPASFRVILVRVGQEQRFPFLGPYKGRLYEQRLYEQGCFLWFEKITRVSYLLCNYLWYCRLFAWCAALHIARLSRHEFCHEVKLRVGCPLCTPTYVLPQVLSERRRNLDDKSSATKTIQVYHTFRYQEHILIILDLLRYFVLFCTFACCFVVLGVEAFVGSISLPVHRFSAATSDSTTTRTRCWQFYFSRSRPEICGKCILWIFVVPFQCFQDDYRIS